MGIKYLDMFSGIGGFRSALDRVGGFECVGFCEIDEKAKETYEAIYDTKGELYFNDAREINPNALPDIDLICGGFPCQSFSIAGKRGGFEDTRGTLFFEIARIAAVKKPKYMLLENVPGLLNHDQGRTFQKIISSLDELGYDVTWQVYNSKNFGVPQSRKRLYIVCYYREKVQGEIFAFPETTASNTVRCIRGSEGDRVYSVDGTSITLTSSAGGFGGKTGLYLIPVISNTKLGYQYAKSGDSIDIAYLGQKQRRGRVGKNEAHTLTTTPSQTYYFIDMNVDPKLTEIARCITARQNAGVSKHKGEHSALLVLVGEFNVDEFSDIYARLHEFVELDEKENKIALLIIVANTQCFVGFIRRLTPKECWRLQGFSDEQYLKSREAGFSDSQQYKQAGNAVTVNVVEALAKRIKIIDERNKGGLNG